MNAKPISLIFLLACSTLLAQESTLDIPYQKFVLKNGLALIVHEDHKAPVVAINIWYHVGSKDEQPGRTGFAHLFEHLMLAGSEHHHNRIMDTLEAIGATDANGTTNSDRTNYFETVPVSALDYTLWLESDRMGHLLGAIDQKTLDLQRGVVQNEKRQGENQPYGLVGEMIAKATYPPGHPYSWTVVGSMDDLNAARMSDVQDWFKTYYGPSNAVIVLAGDIDTNTAWQKVEKYFGDIPAGPPIAANRLWIAKMTGTHRQVMQDRVAQARIYKVWNVPEAGSPDETYLDMVAGMLSAGRLYQRLVYDDQIATDVDASDFNRELGGQFTISATARPGIDLSKVEKAIDEELAGLLASGPTDFELTRAKTQRMSESVRGAERIAGKADMLASNLVLEGSPDRYKDYLKRYQAATKEDVQSAGKRWLTDGVYVLEVHPFPNYETAKTGADRSKPPELGTSPESQLPKLQHSTLSNGLKVVLAERHETPIVNFWLVLDGGMMADQFCLPGTAYAGIDQLLSTKTRNALKVSDDRDMLGAQLGTFWDLDVMGVRLSALKTKIDASLELFADVILNPAYRQEDFARSQKLQLAAIEQEKLTGMSMAMRVLPALLYGSGHPYGSPLSGSGTTESVSKLTRDDLVKFHHTWFRPNNGTLIVTGDTNLAEITPKLEKLFGAWEQGDIPVRKIAPAHLQDKPVMYLMDRPGALQSEIVVGQLAPARNDANEIALETVTSILGADFGSRLNMNLREDKHWAYGASTFIIAARGQQPFLATAPVQTDKTVESLRELSREFHDIVSSRPPTAAELRHAQDSRTLKLSGALETVDQVGNAILEQVKFGLPDDYYDTLAGKVRALDVAAVTAAAKATIHPDNMVWVVAGDRAKIEKGIRQLGWGEVKFLDADGNPK